MSPPRLVNPCTAPRSSTMVAGTGPFTRTSIRRIFGSALLRDCLRDCLIASSVGGGRPFPTSLKATTFICSLALRSCVPQHVRVRLDLEPSNLTSLRNQLLKVGHRHRRAALGHEQERRSAFGLTVQAA